MSDKLTKRTSLNIRISDSEYDNFVSSCKERCMGQSAVLRKFMRVYVNSSIADLEKLGF